MSTEYFPAHAKRRMFIVLFALLGFLFYFLRAELFDLIFPGKAYAGRSAENQLWIILALVGVAAILAWLLSGLLTSNVPGSRHLKGERGQNAALGMLTLGILLIVLFNAVLPFFDFRTMQNEPMLDPYPYQMPIGSDYRLGIAIPIDNLIQHGSPYLLIEGIVLAVYPPFMYAFFAPLSLLSQDAGYLVTLAFAVVSVIAGVLLTAMLLQRYLKLDRIYLWLGTALVLVYLVTSPFFKLMIDRGNIDGIMYFLMVLTIYLMLTRPRSLWAQVIILSIATHLKVFPVLLFPLLLIFHGKKLILPAIVINLLLAFSLGPNVLLAYLQTMGAWPVERYYWIGNHSAASLAVLFQVHYPSLKASLGWLFPALFALPLVMAAVLAWLNHKLVKGDLKWMLDFLLLCALMCLLPNVSHDYKLIVLSSAILVFLLLILEWTGRRFDASRAAYFTFFLLILFVFQRPYTYIGEHLWLLKSHYPSVLALFVTFYLVLPETPLVMPTSGEESEPALPFTENGLKS